MSEKDWSEFRGRFPELARAIAALGARLYEMGVEEAASSQELIELQTLIERAPPDARTLLGFASIPNKQRLLGAVVEWGSTLLLRYVRTGTC